MRFSHYVLAVLSPLISSPSYSPFASASSYDRNPLTAIDTIRDASVDTPSHRVSAFSKFDLSFFAFKRRIRFSLEPNHDILPADARINYLGPDGEIAHSEPIERHLHRVYKGDVHSQNVDGSYSMVGHARIMLHEDGDKPVFEGSFSIDHDSHHIHLKDKYISTKHDLDPDAPEEHAMLISRDSDIDKTWTSRQHEELKKRGPYPADIDVACPADQLEFNMDVQHPVFSGQSMEKDLLSIPVNDLWKRQLDSPSGPGNSAGVNLIPNIGQTNGCPQTRKVALIGVATDCEYTSLFPNTEEVRKNIIAVVNSASSVYERTFSISIGLQNLTISPAGCPGTPPAQTPWNVNCDGADIQQRLNLFSQWRGRQPDNNSHWTLMTKCRTGSAVGLAWLGQSCIVSAEARNASSGVVQTISGANVVARTGNEWQVFAHETGHTFGAVHDCTSASCADGTSQRQMCCPLSGQNCDAGQRYIMNPSTSQGITDFSPCSVGNICSAFGRSSVKSQCFSNNRGVPLITAAQCGNGIVEDGEDCDCGGSQGCGQNRCCNPATCKFTTGSVCDDSNEECCRGCKFAPANTICRASTGVCDPEEKCGGQNATCPSDNRAPDGQGCGNGLKCANGHCTSRDLQCRTLMGAHLQGNETYACDPYVCTLSCSSPQLERGKCLTISQNFLDGTECGGGGKCRNGQCRDSSFAKEIGGWISKNKEIVIGAACGAGGLVLLCILSCLWSRRKRVKASRAAAKQWAGTNRAPPTQQYPPPRGPSQQQSWRYG